MPMRAPKLCLHPREPDRPNAATRRLYNQVRWKRLRALVLSENPLCVDCQRDQRVSLATEVHHRERHGGNLEKFYDRRGLEGLCARHHAMKTARGE